MATAEIPLQYSGAETVAGVAASAKGASYLTFDPDAVEEVRYRGVVPDNYASGPVLTVYYSMQAATSGTVGYNAYVMAVTPDDAADIDTDSFDSANAASETVPGTAGYMSELDITLTNADSMAAGDVAMIKLQRNVADTASGDAKLRGVVLRYTVA